MHINGTECHSRRHSMVSCNKHWLTLKAIVRLWQYFISVACIAFNVEDLDKELEESLSGVAAHVALGADKGSL